MVPTAAGPAQLRPTRFLKFESETWNGTVGTEALPDLQIHSNAAILALGLRTEESIGYAIHPVAWHEKRVAQQLPESKSSTCQPLMQRMSNLISSWPKSVTTHFEVGHSGMQVSAPALFYSVYLMYDSFSLKIMRGLDFIAEIPELRNYSTSSNNRSVDIRFKFAIVDI